MQLDALHFEMKSCFLFYKQVFCIWHIIAARQPANTIYFWYEKKNRKTLTKCYPDYPPPPPLSEESVGASAIILMDNLTGPSLLIVFEVTWPKGGREYVVH